MTRTERIVSVLADGPALTSEVARELGVRTGTVAAHLASLHRQGRVERAPFHSGRPATVWTLREAAA